MLTKDETKEARVVLNKLDKMLIDIEFGDIDEVMEKGIDTLKMIKTSYLHFVSESAKAGYKDGWNDAICACKKEVSVRSHDGVLIDTLEDLKKE